MGQIKEIICDGCNTSWEIRVGAGRLQGDLQYITSYFSENDQKEIRSFFERGDNVSFELEAGYCENCNNLVSKPVLKVEKADKVVIGICAKCKNKLNHCILEDIGCPICQSKKWRKRFIGMWD